jgi:TRAP-type C4-dicarboxylate transport system substrate-binding protein
MPTLGTLIRTTCLALTVAALPATASAQQVIKLTAMDGYPPRALWVKEFIEFFIPEVDKRLAAAGNRYKIEWTQGWSGQIVKIRSVLDGVQNGLGDIAIITTVFYGDRLPLNNLPYYVPFTSGNPHLVARTMDKLAANIPAYKKQFEDVNQVVLTSFSTIDDYGIFLKNPISKASELKGLKINMAGANALYLSSVGAVGVAGDLVTYYNNIKTGVVDGAIMWMEGGTTFKLYEVAPYYLKTGFGTMTNKALSVNKNTWNKLPDEVKKVFQDVAVAYREHLADLSAKLGEQSLKTHLANGGKVIELSEAERVTWAKSLPNIAQKWAEDTEKKGLPAKAALAAYMDAIRAGGAKPLRNWDKE